MHTTARKALDRATTVLRMAKWMAVTGLLFIGSVLHQAQATLITLVFVDPSNSGDVQFIAASDAVGPSFTIAESTFSPTRAHVLGFCHDDGGRCSAFEGMYSLALNDPVDENLDTLVTVSWATLSTTSGAFELNYYANPADDLFLEETLADFPILQWKYHSAALYCDPLQDAACTMQNEFVFHFGSSVIGIVDATESTPEPASIGMAGLAVVALVVARRRTCKLRTGSRRA